MKLAIGVVVASLTLTLASFSQAQSNNRMIYSGYLGNQYVYIYTRPGYARPAQIFTPQQATQYLNTYRQQVIVSAYPPPEAIQGQQYPAPVSSSGGCYPPYQSQFLDKGARTQYITQNLTCGLADFITNYRQAKMAKKAAQGKR